MGDSTQAQDDGPTATADAPGAGEHVAAERGVRVEHTGFERYRVTTRDGAELEFGRGEGLVDPVDMLLAALAGCMAISIEQPLLRAAEPERLDIDVVADKLQDDSRATRLQNLRLELDLELRDRGRAQDLQTLVDRLLTAAHETHCTVSRTLEAGARTEATAQVTVTGSPSAEDRDA